MNMETLIDRILWLTESLYGTIIFLTFSIFTSYIYHSMLSVADSDKIAPILLPYVSMISTGSYGVTGILFIVYLIRRQFN